MTTRTPSPRAQARPRRAAKVRTPELSAYLRAGGVVGFLLGAAVALFGRSTDISSPLQQVVLLGVIAAALGVLVASFVYLVVDWYRHLPRW